MKNGKMIDRWGNECWFKDGQFHRDDGPAISHTYGSQSPYKNGRLHRLDGPAVIYSDGRKQWWFHNKQFSEEEWWRMISEEARLKTIFNWESF